MATDDTNNHILIYLSLQQQQQKFLYVMMLESYI